MNSGKAENAEPNFFVSAISLSTSYLGWFNILYFSVSNQDQVFINGIIIIFWWANLIETCISYDLLLFWTQGGAGGENLFLNLACSTRQMQGNGGSCSYSHHGLEMEAIDGRKELDFKGQNGDSSRSLKSRGLCLVPLSLFANSVGWRIPRKHQLCPPFLLVISKVLFLWPCLVEGMVNLITIATLQGSLVSYNKHACMVMASIVMGPQLCPSLFSSPPV